MAYTDFPAEKIRLTRVYESKLLEKWRRHALVNRRIEEIYGELSFPGLPKDRPYTYGSFVNSIDGRIAFTESPDGMLVARKNEYDAYGGLCDYWILTMLRSISDAVLMGSLTIAREPELTARIADKELEAARIRAGREAVPLHVIVTRSGKNLPPRHTILRSPDIPALVVSSPKGRDRVRLTLGEDCEDLGVIGSEKTPLQFSFSKDFGLYQGGGIHKPFAPLSIIGIGSDSEGFDEALLLRILKIMGIHSMLIESPTFLSSLMRKSLLDELYINTSGLFIGGKALTIGENTAPFTIDDHPHTRVLSIHSHSDHFFYTRYMMIYR
jgi:riboflavin biosynthesis pyrimidine reductase